MEDHSQLYKEAAAVGIALVPMWYAVSLFTTATKVLNNSPQMKAMMDVAVSGFLFHLTAEESGLNVWYLSNSYAYKKSFQSEFKKDEHCALDHTGWGGGNDFGALFGIQGTHGGQGGVQR
jgi:hypothetical protein